MDERRRRRRGSASDLVLFVAVFSIVMHQSGSGAKTFVALVLMAANGKGATVFPIIINKKRL